MRIPTPKLPALFTRPPSIEGTGGDSHDDGLTSRRALFTDAVYETDLLEGLATEISDPWSNGITSLLSGTRPDQDVDYILLADADIKFPPSDYGTLTSPANTAEIWTCYSEDVSRAYVYLNHLISPVHPKLASTAAASKTAHTVNDLTNSAIQTILRQLDNTTMNAAQLTRKNTILRATIARYEQENEELEDMHRMLTNTYNAERRLCWCVGNDEGAYSESVIQRYGEGRFVKGGLHSWEMVGDGDDWVDEAADLRA
ncbi:uncharacterized protein ALTATR162_LOCUS3451 [Alternaria atra]|uniref:Uncharacterized protein n=1 Tax=Alternaria atra TaxID=119953 RepID=A0A8J2N047_9PLEO|nr:uncharacterized protein ALTATR162_LOCUS3451 [Alternaria atra]CAG5154065.1 unnamed protein product [Alternaria atra]